MVPRYPTVEPVVTYQNRLGVRVYVVRSADIGIPKRLRKAWPYWVLGQDGSRVNGCSETDLAYYQARAVTAPEF